MLGELSNPSSETQNKSGATAGKGAPNWMVEWSTVSSKKTFGKKDVISCGYSTGTTQELRQGSPQYPVNKTIEILQEILALISLNYWFASFSVFTDK